MSVGATDRRRAPTAPVFCLSEVEIFAHLDLQEMADLAAAAPMRTVPAGTLLRSPHDLRTVLSIVEAGSVRLYRLLPEGRRLTVAVLGPGAVRRDGTRRSAHGGRGRRGPRAQRAVPDERGRRPEHAVGRQPHRHPDHLRPRPAAGRSGAAAGRHRAQGGPPAAGRGAVPARRGRSAEWVLSYRGRRSGWPTSRSRIWWAPPGRRPPSCWGICARRTCSGCDAAGSSSSTGTGSRPSPITADHPGAFFLQGVDTFQFEVGPSQMPASAPPSVPGRWGPGRPRGWRFIRGDGWIRRSGPASGSRCTRRRSRRRSSTRRPG